MCVVYVRATLVALVCIVALRCNFLENPVPVDLRERKKAYTREAIALAALTLFQQQGVAATSVQEIAELAEVAKRTVNNYFPTKDELVVAVLDLMGAGGFVTPELLSRPQTEHPITAFRRSLAERGASLTDADARALRKVLSVMHGDPELRKAYMLQFDSAVTALVEAMAERAAHHGLDDAALLTACACCLQVIDSVGSLQPARPSARTWLAQVDEALGRLERGWLR